MDFLENPFFILDATPLDNRARIMDRAVTCGLFQDPARCREAKAILMSPRKRIYAEIAWLPVKNSEQAKKICELLESSIGNSGVGDRLGRVQDYLAIDALMPIAKCNVLAAGLRRLPRHSSDTIAAWTLEFAHASEAIIAENLCEIINSDRKVACFLTAKLPYMETEIENLREHYRQVMASAMNKLSAEERAAAMTTVVESATDNERQAPLLINRLVDWYELEAQKSLEEHEAKIGELDEKLRLAADENHPDSVLSSLVKQVTQSVKDWKRVAKPIQVSRESRGLSQDESKCVAQRVRDLAMHLFDMYDRLDFCLQLLRTFQEAFAEVMEISKDLGVDMNRLTGIARERERGARLKIESLIEELRTDVDRNAPDSTLRPMLDELIRTVKNWKASAQLCEKHYADFYIKVVANHVQGLAHHLRNEHRKFDDSRKLFGMFQQEFPQVGEIADRVIEHPDELDVAKSVQGDISLQVSKLQTAVDAKQPDSILSEMANQLIQTVKEWKTCAQPIEAYYADYYHVANLVMKLALHFREKYRELDISGRLFKILQEEFAELGEIGSSIDGHLMALENTENARGEIILQEEKLRAAAREKQPDSVLSEMVNQLIQTVKEWKALAQPLESYRTDHYNVANLVMELALHLWKKYRKLDISGRLFKTLREEFAELGEIGSLIDEHLKVLETTENARGDIILQDAKLRAAAREKQPDSVLSEMVNQLIQTVKEWKTCAQPMEAHYADYYHVANLVKELALDLKNEHEMLDDSRQLLKMIQQEFAEIDEIAALVTEHLDALEAADSARQHIEIQAQGLRDALYAKHYHPDLSPRVNQLIQSVKGWRDLAQPIKAYYGDYCGVAKLVLELAVSLWKKGKRRSYDQLFKMLQDIFGEIPEIVTLLAEEAKARDEAEKKYARRHDRKRARWRR